jgi:hypothetical protein
MSEGVKGTALAAITCNWGGHECSGFGEDGAFSIEPSGERFNVVEGVDGSVVRAHTGSSLWVVKIKLLQTSATNAFFTAIHLLDTVDSTGVAGALPFVVKDANGLDAFLSPAMWIQKPPTMERSNKPMTQEWEFRAADGKMFYGGNNLLGIVIP